MPSDSSGQVGAAEPMIWTTCEPPGLVDQTEPVLSMDTEVGLLVVPVKMLVQVVVAPRQGLTLFEEETTGRNSMIE